MTINHTTAEAVIIAMQQRIDELTAAVKRLQEQNTDHPLLAQVETHLTATEWRILRKLTSRPGAIVRRDDLMASSGFHRPTVNTLQARICRLRGKLEQYAPGWVIAAVDGVGYVLREETNE